ncbi:MAG TPA: solute carrier family 23 protein [Methanospirillum sp.]|nr:solute carrier family 23 protein [Methanospirillum sp.]
MDEKPPLIPLFLLGLQHVFIITISLIFPVVIVKTVGGSDAEAVFMVSMGMLAAGLVTMMQSYGKHGIGSGYLCPSLCGPSYLSSAIMAAQAGGLHLLFGMIFLSGVAEAMLSRVISRLRTLFPAEVTGVVVTFVGIAVLPIAFPRFVGYNAETGMMNSIDLIIAVITLSIMIGLNLYTKGRIKLYCVLIGMICGYILSALLGVLNYSHIGKILDAPLLGFPELSHFGLAFDVTLILPFLIAMICSTLKSIGDITTCQRANDLDWKRPDMNNIQDGILADGLADVISGLLGTFSQSTSSSNVGLSIGTGATSRYIGYSIGAIFIVLSCFPKLAMMFVIMPSPVMGAALLYTVCFMVIAGLQIINSRMMDVRKTFVIGLSFLIGLSAMMPGIYTNIPEILKPVFASTLSLATISVIILNLLLRIGIKSSKVLIISPHDNAARKIFDFMKLQGGEWGARPEIVSRATSAINEGFEAISLINPDIEGVEVQVSFDELNLDADIRYKGAQLDIQMCRPSDTIIAEDDRGIAYLASYMLHRYADRVSTHQKGDISHVFIHFDH